MSLYVTALLTVILRVIVVDCANVPVLTTIMLPRVVVMVGCIVCVLVAG
jgi:hypothetical protein